MNEAEIIKSFRQKVCREIEVEPEGLDRFIVYTPFHFDDGDHYVVILKREQNHWVLTDEGHTFMHLSYSGIDLTCGSRAEVVNQAIDNQRMVNSAGELRLEIPDSDFGDALFSFLQVLSRIATTALWTHDRVKSTFHEDLARILEATVPPSRLKEKFSDPVIDPDGIYPVDYTIENTTDPDRPWFVFAIGSDDECRIATISCLHYEKLRKRFKGVAIFENQVDINRRALAQLSDVVGKSFSSLSDRDRIRAFLEEEVIGPKN